MHWISSTDSCVISRLNTTDNYRLEADCRRLLSYQSNSTAAAAVHMKGEVSYAIKMRLMQGSSSSSEWDIEKVVDAKSLIISSSGGFSVVGVVGSGAVLDIHTLNSADKRDVFIVDGEPYQQVAVFAPVVQTLSFESSGPGFGSILPHPVCSAYTSTHHPATYSAMEELVHHYQRTTSFLRTQLLFPPFLQILFDTDTCRQYERLFQLLFKASLPSLFLYPWVS